MLNFVEVLRNICSQFKNSIDIKTIKEYSPYNQYSKLKTIRINIVNTSNNSNNNNEYEAFKNILFDRMYLKNFNIVYDNPGIGQGQTKVFFSNCCESLYEKLFKDKDFENGVSYLKQEITDNNSLSSDIKIDLVCFGYLMAIYIVNEFVLPFKLSTLLLHYCIYKTEPSKDPSYTFLILIEKHDLNIEHLAMQLECSDKSQGKSSCIKKNVSEFYVPKAYKYIMYGFSVLVTIGDILKTKEISPFELQKALCSIAAIDMDDFINTKLLQMNFSDDELKQILLKILKEFDTDTHTDMHIEHKNKQKDVEYLSRKEYEIELLKVNNKVREEEIKHILKKIEKEKYKLFYFWGATEIPNNTMKYQIILDTDNGLFKSQTCFNQLKVPIIPKNIDNKNILRERLIRSINETSRYLTIAG